MISFDVLFMSYIKIIIDFIMINKITLLTIYYILDKIAQKTKTTLDDKILTLIKNIFLRLIGRSDIVISKYQNIKTEKDIIKKKT